MVRKLIIKVPQSLKSSPKCSLFFVDKNIIYAIFDVLSLIKSMKNNLMTRNFSVNNKIIFFSDIKAVYKKIVILQVIIQSQTRSIIVD